MATALQISTYISNVRKSYANYGSGLAKYQKLGRQEIECYKLRFRLLTHFIKIIVDYLDRGINYSTKNFFTIAEARDVIQHINNIMGTNFMLPL